MKILSTILFLFFSTLLIAKSIKSSLGKNYNKWVVLYNPLNPTEICLFNNFENFSYYENDIKNIYGVVGSLNEIWALNNRNFLYRKILDSSNFYRPKFFGEQKYYTLKIKKIQKKEFLLLYLEKEVVGKYEYIETIQFIDDDIPYLKMKLIKMKAVINVKW